jgi:hypothetical protein
MPKITRGKQDKTVQPERLNPETPKSIMLKGDAIV